MKRLFPVLLSLMIAVSPCLLAAAEEEATILRPVFDGKYNAKGALVISIVIENNPGFVSFGLDISYNKAHLTPVSAAQTTGIDGLSGANVNYDPAAGIARAGFASMGESVTGDKGILTLSFAVADGLPAETVTRIEIVKADLYGKDSQAIELETKALDLTLPGNFESAPAQSPPSDTKTTNAPAPAENGASVPSPSPVPAAKFQDLKDFQWAKDQIETLAAAGIINGTSAQTFSPEKPIARADFVALLVRIKKPSAEAGGNFTDVTPDKYYAREIALAKAMGLTQGIGGGLFAPEEPISRQDMFVFVSRLLTLEEEADLSAYADADRIADYARAPMAQLLAAGLIQGSGSALSPQSQATRAETAVFLFRAYSRLTERPATE